MVTRGVSNSKDWLEDKWIPVDTIALILGTTPEIIFEYARILGFKWATESNKEKIMGKFSINDKGEIQDFKLGLLK